MYACGVSTRGIGGYPHDLYSIDVSPDLISTVTDVVLDEIVTWQQRPLNQQPRYFGWRTDPDDIIATLRRGHQTLG